MEGGGGGGGWGGSVRKVWHTLVHTPTLVLHIHSAQDQMVMLRPLRTCVTGNSGPLLYRNPTHDLTSYRCITFLKQPQWLFFNCKKQKSMCSTPKGQQKYIDLNPRGNSLQLTAAISCMHSVFQKPPRPRKHYISLNEIIVPSIRQKKL